MGERITPALLSLRKAIGYIPVKTRDACRNCVSSAIKDAASEKTVGKEYYCDRHRLHVAGGGICSTHERMKK